MSVSLRPELTCPQLSSFSLPVSHWEFRMPNSCAYHPWVPRALSLGSNRERPWWGPSNHPPHSSQEGRAQGSAALTSLNGQRLHGRSSSAQTLGETVCQATCEQRAQDANEPQGQHSWPTPLAHGGGPGQPTPEEMALQSVSWKPLPTGSLGSHNSEEEARTPPRWAFSSWKPLAC